MCVEDRWGVGVGCLLFYVQLPAVTMYHYHVFLFFILYGSRVCSQVISIFRCLQVNAESVGVGSTVVSTCFSLY